MGMKRWFTPIPPLCAIAMAMADSVTESMFALTIGMLSLMFLLSFVERSTSFLEWTELRLGTSKTSSKVSASLIGIGICDYLRYFCGSYIKGQGYAPTHAKQTHNMATIPTDVMRKVQAAIKQAQSARCGGRPTTLDNETGSSDQLLSLF